MKKNRNRNSDKVEKEKDILVEDEWDKKDDLVWGINL